MWGPGTHVRGGEQANARSPCYCCGGERGRRETRCGRETKRSEKFLTCSGGPRMREVPESTMQLIAEELNSVPLTEMPPNLVSQYA